MPLPYAVCPTPTIAVWSLIVTALLPTLELRGTALDEGHHPLLGVLGAAHQLLGVTLVPHRAVAVGVHGPVGQPLGEGDGLGGAGRQAAGPLAERLLQIGARDHLVRQADAVRLGRGDVVAEE